MMTLSIRILALLSIGWLSACGGGGGSSDEERLLLKIEVAFSGGGSQVRSHLVLKLGAAESLAAMNSFVFAGLAEDDDGLTVSGVKSAAYHATVAAFTDGEASIISVSVNGVGSSFPENDPKVEFVEPNLGPVDLAGWAIDRIEFACDDISVEHPNNNTVFSLAGRLLIYGHRL